MAENNRVVDARGRSCPEPVLMTKKALAQQSGRLQVLVDNQVAVDNITRFAQNKGLAVRVENKGSDFSFTLLQTVGRRPAEEDDKLTDGALAGLEGARILLVEDNELNLEIARTILEMQKCQVETALNGQEGVDRFCESSEGYYDLILMDIRMPVMDGLEAAKLIRASGRTDARTVPIVAMSANAFEEDVKKSLESGMNAHLAKPFQMEDLIRTMRRIIGRENRVGKNGPGETETE